MKLRNVAMKNGKNINLELEKEHLIIVPNEEFEISDERGKELLKKKIDNNSIVEKVKEEKTSKEA